MKVLRALCAAGLLATTACAWWMAGRPGWRTADELRFDHGLHHENGVECGDCHGDVAAAIDTVSLSRPAEEVCLQCHEREGNCQMCHSDPEAVRDLPSPNSRVVFSHVAHVGDRLVPCQRCHPAAMGDAGSVAAGMDVCLGCHKHRVDYDGGLCLDCHPTLRALPLAAVAEFDHTGDWLSRHGMMARAQRATCGQCHTQSSCSECHSRVPGASPALLRPEAVDGAQLHRGDFAAVHAIEARADGDSCLRCHRTPFCQRCHSAVGLVPAVTSGLIVHPAGYALRGSAVFHGDDARDRIESCAACHEEDAASVCVECHAVGGTGGDPHPSGWAARHDESDAKGEVPCNACHR